MMSLDLRLTGNVILSHGLHMHVSIKLINMLNVMLTTRGGTEQTLIYPTS